MPSPGWITPLRPEFMSRQRRWLQLLAAGANPIRCKAMIPGFPARAFPPLLLRGAALLISLTAGMTGKEAHAGPLFTPCLFGDNNEFEPCLHNDRYDSQPLYREPENTYLSILSFDYKGAFGGPTTGTGNLNYFATGAARTVVITFSPTLSAMNSGVFEYQLDNLSPEYFFNFFSVSQTADPGTTILTRLYSDSSFTNEVASLDTATPGSQAIPGQLNTIYVRSSYSINPGGSLDGFSNTFHQTSTAASVPSPLLLAGGGAVLHLSRRLRRRFRNHGSPG